MFFPPQSLCPLFLTLQSQLWPQAIDFFSHISVFQSPLPYLKAHESSVLSHLLVNPSHKTFNSYIVLCRYIVNFYVESPSLLLFPFPLNPWAYVQLFLMPYLIIQLLVKSLSMAFWKSWVLCFREFDLQLFLRRIFLRALFYSFTNQSASVYHCLSLGWVRQGWSVPSLGLEQPCFWPCWGLSGCLWCSLWLVSSPGSPCCVTPPTPWELFL